jgi:hypothetical protein
VVASSVVAVHLRTRQRLDRVGRFAAARYYLAQTQNPHTRRKDMQTWWDREEPDTLDKPWLAYRRSSVLRKTTYLAPALSMLRNSGIAFGCQRAT